MPTVFIAGSIAISRLHPDVQARIGKAVDNDLDIVVGDADGADSAIQTCLHDKGARRVTIYCSGDTPRNNIGDWPIHHVYPTATPGTRAYFTAKDLEMADSADYGLMIWDTRSTGTLSNVLELTSAGKPAVVFVNKTQVFLKISSVDDIDLLVGQMSSAAREKAESKMRLSHRLGALRNMQWAMPL